jgi:hypothetical protein
MVSAVQRSTSGRPSTGGLDVSDARRLKSLEEENAKLKKFLAEAMWPALGSADTELGVLMEPELCHGEAEVYTGVQA